MKLRKTAEGVIVEDPQRGRWIAAPQADDMLTLLAGGADARAKVEAQVEAVAGDVSAAVDPGAAGLPFEAHSLRAFSLWKSHYEGSARMLVKRFFPPPVRRAASAFERVTRHTFPPFKPNKRFYETPAFYVGNHAAMLADGEEMPWPSHTDYLDFELELAFVLARPLADPTPAEAREAIGGWLVLNDWSAREVQADEVRHGMFGPAVKSKTFANSLGCDVLTPDELPDWTVARGRVRVDGEVWCEGGTAEPAHDVGEMLAYAAAGERLAPGDVISTGTMPGCCGLELDRWIQPGQTVELEIDGIGTLTNRIGEQAVRKLLAAGSVLGLFAHNAFETRAGVGLVFEPFLGRRGAFALWGAYFPAMLAAAASDREGARRLTAFSAGIGVAGVAVHFKAWPWSLHGGLPMLDEAEGLREDQLPAYNSVLWFWLLCSALSLPAANRPGARRFALAGLLNFPILLASARHHFEWAREQAELEPERWSPALRES